MTANSGFSLSYLDAGTLAQSITLLDSRIDWIPMGWQRLYVDLRFALRNVDCDKRAHVPVEGGLEEDGHLYVYSSSEDRVVQGLLRKARTRALYTCTKCGRPGKPRDDEWDKVSLCGRCEGARRLAYEVRRLLSLHRCGSIHLPDELKSSPSTAVVRVAWEVSSGTAVHTCAEASVEALKDWLERLLTAAEAAYGN